MMRFIYRDKEYNSDEWLTKKEFVDRIKLPEDLFIDWRLRKNSVIYDIGYLIVIDKYRGLYRLIASSRSALINSFDKFYESNIIQLVITILILDIMELESVLK